MKGDSVTYLMGACVVACDVKCARRSIECDHPCARPFRCHGDRDATGAGADVDDGRGLGDRNCAKRKLHREFCFWPWDEHVVGHAERASKKPLRAQEMGKWLAACSPDHHAAESRGMARMDGCFGMRKEPLAFSVERVREEQVRIANINA